MLEVFLEMQKGDPQRIWHHSEIQQEMIKRGYKEYDRWDGFRSVISILRRIEEVEIHEKSRYRLDLGAISQGDADPKG